MTRQIFGDGTTEAEWSTCAGLNEIPFESLDSLLPANSRLLVCAPHPDDEVLPCGGLLAAASDAGKSVTVIAITNGEASHGPDIAARENLRVCRPRESEAAIRELNPRIKMQRLGLPDGAVERFEPLLTEELCRHFREGDVVITPWRLDGHPDHEATARAAIRATAEVGCALLETPIWGWHWSHPDNCPLNWETGVKFRLSSEIRSRKQRAIQEFRTQIQPAENRSPILSPSTLERFARGWEVFFR